MRLLWRPDWIEVPLGFDPDGHSGSLEMFITIGLAAATVLFSGSAWRQWQRLRREMTAR